MNPAEDGLPIPQRYWAILTLMVGLAMSCLDTAIVNVALPAIARDLHTSAADSIWVVNAYQLAVMISLLPLASLGDIFGYRRVYRLGLVVYTAAALISALAGSLDMLTLGRALQGLGAAGVMSVNTALVRFTYPRRQLGRGIALVSLVVAVSSAAGPSVAAAILAVAPWPWLFAINVPIGIVTFLLAMRCLPYTAPSEHRFDLWSAALSAVMFGALISGINGIGHGQAAAAVAAEFAGAVAVGWLLVRRQVSQALGASAVETGLLITPWAVMTAILAPIAGRLADRHPAGILGGIGLAVLAAGFVMLAMLPAHPTTADIVWRVALCGCGFGLFQSPNNRAIVASAPRERSGGAGAIQGTARLLGQSIGAALVALVFGLAQARGGHGATTAIWLAAGFAGIAVLASLARLFDVVRITPPPARSTRGEAQEPAE